MKIQLVHKFENIISIENLLLAWQEFVVGKSKKIDVQIYSSNLMDNILDLNKILVNKDYQHGNYQSFYINDPKRRHIFKASVNDRLLHHAVYRILYSFFDKTFIFNSYSCRLNKGTHKAIKQFRAMFHKVSKNNTKACWILKCDIKRFFDNINHEILIKILKSYIGDQSVIWLLENIINSYHSNNSSIGLPLGNLTSQLFSNIYLNVFDQWAKHKLKAKYYIRYADDFVFLSDNKKWLANILPEIQCFLSNTLKIDLHPDKTYIQTVARGIDFLGWKNFPNYRILRNKTKKRMLLRLKDKPTNSTLQSYLGLLKHGNSHKIRQEIISSFLVEK